jgi:hypothetical protein
MLRQSQADLPQVVRARRPPGRPAGRLHGREQEPDQEADDRDDGQQLDERETAAV